MGVYEGGFECPPGEGVGCKSISEVNVIVDKSAVIADQLSVIGNQSAVPSAVVSDDLQEGVSFGGRGAACKNGSGSCSSSEIWYAPSVILDQNKKIDSQNKCTPKVLDDAHSI